ncbi:unnamed protein product [Chironomus riparius]|uniref:Uncharacterized protein n=1 Tax=Chironomus riparius TaxID=315576 RepID=A0A9N9WLQ8_9DIPT|nr:unnamed protein product [Chironomus riparius]
MKSSRIILEFLLIFMSFNLINGQDIQWGIINTDSIRIDLPAHFTLNLTAGTNASLNATMRVSRTIHGLKLQTINSPGANGEIINGGIGFNFVTFMLQGNSSYFYFIAEAFENNTLGVETTTVLPTTPKPEETFEEWGVINTASLALNPKTYYSASSNPGQITQRDVSINAPKIIHGIRVTSYNNTVANANITDGGIGSNFTTIRVLGRANFLSFSIELFENGISTPAPTTTVGSTTVPTTIQTTPIPEKRIEEWGRFDDIALLDEIAFQNYPPIWSTANENATITVNGVILGIRLTSLNYTTGLYELIGGGLEQNFVTFNFRGSRAGGPYDFNIEIFGNSSVSVKLSMALVAVLSLLFSFLR